MDPGIFRKYPLKPAAGPAGLDTFLGTMKPLALSIRSALALGAAIVAACVSGSGGHGDGLAEGHYFLAGRFDADYAYEQYFVVLPENRYEWVEYGYNASDNRVCKVTRHAGALDLGESGLSLVREKDAGPQVKCGFTKKDFQSMKWTDRQEAARYDFEIRNVGEDGFEAKAFFDTSAGFRSIVRRGDPYGFYD